MKLTSDYLYGLLPAHHRVLDAEAGEPLRALVEVLAAESARVEENVDQLYDNWFIETCEEWVVPYLGDLLGVRPLRHVEGTAAYSQRAYVANTFAYRRGKGTTAIVEQLARDVTGYGAYAREFFETLVATQHLNHLRLHNTVTPDLSRPYATDRIGGPFESAARTVEVGRIGTGAGRHNIMNLGVYLWRLTAYPLAGVEAHPDHAGAYHFGPLALDQPLFNIPRSEDDEEGDRSRQLPVRVRRFALHEEVEAYRSALAAPSRHPTPAAALRMLAESGPLLAIYRDGVRVPTAEIAVCNLEDWRPPPASLTYQTHDGSGGTVDLPVQASVDPRLGRLVLNDPVPGERVLVDWAYGFSGDLGGGPYDRNRGQSMPDDLTIDWQAGVSKTATPVGGESIHPTLAAAVAEWNALGDNVRTGLITVMDNRTYAEDLVDAGRIVVASGKSLLLIAADWPVVPDPEGGIGSTVRTTGTYNAEDRRAHLRGTLEILGAGTASGEGSLTIDGFLLEGDLTLLDGRLGSLTLSHATIPPGSGAITLGNQEGILHFNLRKAITGAIACRSEDARLNLADSIIDHGPGTAVDAPTSQLDIQRCTVWGTVTAQELTAGNSLFNDRVTVRRRQSGCVRFSYLPPSSVSPRRYRCQPELAIQEATDAVDDPEEISRLTTSILQRLVPVYDSRTYGQPTFARLSVSCPREVGEGSDNGSEMGAFNFLRQAHRLANLRTALAEYVRVGIEAGLITLHPGA